MMGEPSPSSPPAPATASAVALASPWPPAAAPALLPAASAALPAPTAPQAASSGADALQPLLLLQAFDGPWTLGDALAAVLGMPLLSLTPPAGISEAAWGTALGLAFLRLRFSARQEEWALVAEKARGWLRAAGCDVERLTALASEALSQ